MNSSNQKNLFDLSGETAVIIGGTGVLGGALAAALAAAGAKTAVAGRSAERGTARATAIREAGGISEFFPVDASSPASLNALRDAVEARFGPITVLVNAAGGNDPKVTVTADHSFEQIETKAWLENFDLNLVGGALLPCQAFGPAMVAAGKGSIINIASVSAHLPLSRVVAYSAAKAAVLSLTMFLAREWAPHGVRVNSITPGFFPAEQNRRLLFNEDGSPTARAASILGHTPMGRFGGAEELSGAAVFLASPQAASFVTGIDLRVDGGFLSQTI
jgi:NAD(P)-dependent dehydrogenase (short-subunit alcohol dehydrogenase family)